jgi:membrane protein DedA with SNARE-associated domain
MSSFCYTNSLRPGECEISDKIVGLVVGAFVLGMVLAGIICFGMGRIYMADRIRKLIRTTGDLELVKKELGKVPTMED